MYKNNFDRDTYEPDYGEIQERNVSTLGTVSEMLDSMNRISFRRIWEGLDDYRCSRHWS